MKHKLTHDTDPYEETPPEPSIPELGKDWPPPSKATQPQAHAAPQPAPQQNGHANGKQANGDDLMFNRHRPELGEEEQAAVEGNRQMQSDLRYTSVMKKDKDMKKKEAEQKVASIASRSDNVLMKIKAVFPFDFFPNTVIVDANKVTIIDSIFFASESVVSILLEEITDISVDSNFFLGKLNITYSHHPLKPEYYSISALRKKEALKAKEIIQGLLVLRISEGIDLSKLQPDDIIKELERIGKTHENIPAI